MGPGSDGFPADSLATLLAMALSSGDETSNTHGQDAYRIITYLQIKCTPKSPGVPSWLVDSNMGVDSVLMMTTSLVAI